MNNGCRGGSLRINSLSGLRVLFLFGILLWHGGLNTSKVPVPNLGGLGVCFFFVCSGVLEALRHEGSYSYETGEGLRICLKKYRRMLPTYLMVLIPNIFFSLQRGWGRRVLVESALAHLAFLQAWMTNDAPSLAGSCWFFSALLFCYALTPLTSWCLGLISQKLRHVNSFAWVSFLIVYQLMVSACRSGIFYESSYYCPAVRFFEYACAYSFGCVLSQTAYVENPVKGRRATAMQIIAFGVYIALALPRTLHLLEAAYTLLSLGLVASLVCARGVIGRLLEARPLLWLSQFQTDAFISHQNIIWWIGYFLPGLGFGHLVLLDLIGIMLFVIVKKAGQSIITSFRAASRKSV